MKAAMVRNATSSLSRAVDAIERRGVLLVYPQQNRAEPRSLWHELHPGRAMRWTWDEDADPRVSALWSLREELAESRRVVYAKWLGGRATFFSQDVFRAMLATLKATGDLQRGLARASHEVIEVLGESSPMASKALREAVALPGRVNEAAFTRAMRPLWARLLIVGAGEVAEGGYPSLAVGATSLLFEDLWNEADTLTPADAERLEAVARGSGAFARAFKKVKAEVALGRTSTGASRPTGR